MVDVRVLYLDGGAGFRLEHGVPQPSRLDLGHRARTDPERCLDDSRVVCFSASRRQDLYSLLGPPYPRQKIEVAR